MGRVGKSQWEFGELFPAEQQTRTVWSVAELTSRIRRFLEKEFGQVRVTGEITNLKLQTSGHLYFTLKDASAQLSCVLFRGEVGIDRSILQDGRKVTLVGEITVYEPRGVYQLRVTAVELEGLGALQFAFERLKQRLKAEGWFAAERKRPLPKYPLRVGLVTSSTGAAIRDVLHVVGRRNPGLEIVLAPCRVQGEGAAREIAAAISDLNRLSLSGPGRKLDLILITRGGGSLEDLWAFNEEAVARAVFESALPVVSAVGHEVDFSISDFVADLRAATPSAAAELITEGVFSRCAFVGEARSRMAQLVLRHFEQKAVWASELCARLVRLHPRRYVQDKLQRLDDFTGMMSRCSRQTLRQHQTRTQNLTGRLWRVRPTAVLRQRRELVQALNDRLCQQTHHRLTEWASRLEALTESLRFLGPEQVLARGYSVTTDALTGRVLKDAAETALGQRLITRLAKGRVESVVSPGEPGGNPKT